MPVPFNIGTRRKVSNASGDIVFKSISSVSTTFAIRTVGLDDPIWYDGTDTYQPTLVGEISTVTFTNWNDTSEKTVTINVDDVTNIRGLSETEFINKGLTYMDLSLCTIYRDGIILYNNGNLTKCIFPPSSLSYDNDISIYNCDITGEFDMSPITGLDNCRINIYNNLNMTSFIPPTYFEGIEVFNISLTGITILDLSTLNMNAGGTRRLGFGGCPNLTTFISPTVPQGTLQSLNNADEDIPLLSGTLDLSMFGTIKEFYLNRKLNYNFPLNTALTLIKLPARCDTWMYMGNFQNAQIDGLTASFIISARTVQMDNMFAATSLDIANLSPTTGGLVGSVRISDFPELTGTVDLGFLANNGTNYIRTSPGITGLIMPNGLAGNYGSNEFTGFDVGFYIDFTIWPAVVKTASKTLNISGNNMTSEYVNHMLVDLAAHVADEAPGGDLLGRIITINGNNECADYTTGGYNGQASIAVLVEKGFVVNANICTEANTAIARMTSPSAEVEYAIAEYVESEMRTENNNWDKTDDAVFFDVDTEVNAKIALKLNEFTETGTIPFTAYAGFDFSYSASNVKRLSGDIDNSTAGVNMTGIDSMVAHHVKDGGLDIRTVKYQYDLGNVGGTNYAERSWIYSDGTVDNNSRHFSDNKSHLGQFGDSPNHIVISLDGTITGYKDGLLGSTQVNSTGGSTGLNAGTWKIGNAIPQRDTWVAGGIYKHFIYGQGTDFDTSANYTNTTRFHDRMLIKKHSTEVATMLARYTHLTTTEEFALSRLVARSVENGNWDLLDEVYLLGLYNTSNVQTGMKEFVADDEFANITYISGVGISGTQATDVRFWTGYTPSLSTRAASENQINGAILTINGPSVAYGGYVYFTSNTDTLQIKIGLSGYSLGFQGQGSSTANRPNMNTNLTAIYETRGVGVPGWDFYENGTLLNTDGGPNSIQTAETCLLNKSYGGSITPMDGTLKSWFSGGATGFARESWATDLNQCVNEIEIPKANDNNDWDVQDKTYYWDDREMLPDQLENLVNIIDANSDGTTTGRTLNIQSNLGITDNAQLLLDSLVTKGWVIIT